jgi:hypothetical protein
VGRTYGMHERGEFWWENLSERLCFEDLDVDGIGILKLILV